MFALDGKRTRKAVAPPTASAPAPKKIKGGCYDSKNRYYVYVKRSDLKPWAGNYTRNNPRGGIKVSSGRWETVENAVISHFHNYDRYYRRPIHGVDHDKYMATHLPLGWKTGIADFVKERQRRPGFPKPFDVKCKTPYSMGMKWIPIATSPTQLRLMKEESGVFVLTNLTYHKYPNQKILTWCGARTFCEHMV